MTKILGVSVFMVGVCLGVLLCLSLSAIQKTQESVPKAVTEAINAAKAGDDDLARKLLEENLKDLDEVATSTLVDFYALGLGGKTETNKALALNRLLSCEYFAFGEKEFYLSKLLVKQNPTIATDWLLRSAESGYVPALELLSDSGKMTGGGFNPAGVKTEYWAERVKNPIPIELIHRLTSCKIKP
jgi:hypothetical protein